MRAAANLGNETTGGNEMRRRQTKLTPTLEGKDSGHETTTTLGSCKFRGDDGTEGVVTTDTDTHLENCFR